MKYRPNSRHEDTGPDSHNFPLTEYLTIQRATITWDGPTHISYTSKAAGLRPYINWPHGMNPLAPIFWERWVFILQVGWKNFKTIVILIPIPRFISIWKTILLQFGVISQRVFTVAAGYKIGAVRTIRGQSTHSGFSFGFRSIYHGGSIHLRMLKLANTKMDMRNCVT